MANDPTTRLLASAPVSILAPAPQGADDGAPARPPRPSASIALTGNVVAGLGVAAALVALVFLTSSSIDQTVTGGNTWSQIVITFLGAGACAAVVLIGGHGRAWGAPAVAIFAAFTAFAALSIAWSHSPTGRGSVPPTAVVPERVRWRRRFGPAGAAALARAGGGLATAMTALCIYALVAKVFPSTLASANDYGRLLAPFGYWNAIGVAAALGLAPALWAATRPSGSTALRALTIPAMTLMITVIALSYSRSAALVGVVAVAAWAAFVPGRLRTALMLAGGAVRDPDRGRRATQPQPHHRPCDARRPRTSRAMPSARCWRWRWRWPLCAVGFAASHRHPARHRLRTRPPPAGDRPARRGRARPGRLSSSPPWRPRAGASSGQISHAWQSLVSTHSVVFDTPGRITELGSSRPALLASGPWTSIAMRSSKASVSSATGSLVCATPRAPRRPTRRTATCSRRSRTWA